MNKSTTGAEPVAELSTKTTCIPLLESASRVDASSSAVTGTSGRYPPDFRCRVLDLIETGRKIAEVATDLGMSDQTIYTWRRQDRIDPETLKRECRQGSVFATRADARRAIFRWINWYNTTRLHSTVNDVPPLEWEQQYREAS